MGTETKSSLTDVMRVVANNTGRMSQAEARDLLIRAAEAIDAMTTRIQRLESGMIAGFKAKDEQLAQLRRTLEITNEALATKESLMETIRQENTDLREQLAKVPEAVGEWLPIETAPKDGTEIIVGWWQAGVWMVRSARWVDGAELESLEVADWTAADTGWWSYHHSVTQEQLEGYESPSHFLLMPRLPENV